MIRLFLICIFDRYFDYSLKEATQISRGTGARLKIAMLMEIPKNFEFFFTLARKKKKELNGYLAEKFIKMHHENQILSCTYKGTILSLHQEVIENNNEVTITASQSKEPNQQLICPTLHYHSCFFSFEKTVIDIIDTHVVILIKAYLSDILRKNLNVLIYAQMVKSCVYHDMRSMI